MLIITNHHDEECRGVTHQKKAAYEDASTVSGSRLRLMGAISVNCIKEHLKRDNVKPIGVEINGQKGQLPDGTWLATSET